ncbi:Pectate lyase family protein [Perilla frutescens var. hirtella]|nr:Pectate lyase family protein [Perilla frutescens var. hirtella]
MERAELYSFSIILIFAFASTLLPSSTANIAVYDEYWQKRAAEAWNRTLDTYEPIPAKVVSHLNLHTSRALKEIKNGSNGTRRQLAHGYQGPCTATNPIDRCWRCDPNWSNNRFRLADCVLGFGHKAKGGKNGKIYVVSDSSDNDMVNPKPGTLRHAVIQKEPLWIIFDRSMVIRLNQELIMTSDKTIDARGASIHIAHGAGITIQFVRNVIIHGLKIHNIVPGSGGLIRDSVDHYGFRSRSDGDGISIFGSQDIWIDHVSMKQCSDGLIDVIYGSTGITISNGHFTDHNEVMLFGESDAHSQDKNMQITVAFNHFGKRLVQRMPRCRWGYIHVVNNDYTHWNMYAIGGSMNPTIISQGNRYIAPPDNGYAKEVTKREYSPESVWASWTWRSQGDIFLRGAFFVESGDVNYMSKHPQLYDLIEPASAQTVAEITKFSGALGCKVGKPC